MLDFERDMRMKNISSVLFITDWIIESHKFWWIPLHI